MPISVPSSNCDTTLDEQQIIDGICACLDALPDNIAEALGGNFDLEVVCTLDGNSIFIKADEDEGGITTYTNPATGDMLTPGVDFVPCIDSNVCVPIGSAGTVVDWSAI